MQIKLTDGIFDDVQEFPDAEVKRRFERLVGLDCVKDRLVKEAMMRLQPSSQDAWSQRHFNESLPALKFFQREGVGGSLWRAGGHGVRGKCSHEHLFASRDSRVASMLGKAFRSMRLFT